MLTRPARVIPNLDDGLDARVIPLDLSGSSPAIGHESGERAAATPIETDRARSPQLWWTPVYYAPGHFVHHSHRGRRHRKLIMRPQAQDHVVRARFPGQPDFDPSLGQRSLCPDRITDSLGIGYHVILDPVVKPFPAV